MRTKRVVPPSGVDSTWKSPPTAWTLCFIPASPNPRRGRAGSATFSASKSPAVVLDDHEHVAGVAVEDQAHAAGRGVLGDVGQRLLHDAIDGRLDLGREPASHGPVHWNCTGMRECPVHSSA